MATDNSLPTIDMFQPLDGWFDWRSGRMRVLVREGEPRMRCGKMACGHDSPWAPEFSKPWGTFPDLPETVAEKMTS